MKAEQSIFDKKMTAVRAFLAPHGKKADVLRELKTSRDTLLNILKAKSENDLSFYEKERWSKIQDCIAAEIEKENATSGRLLAALEKNTLA